MQSLPPEVAFEVLRCLPKRDLKAVRLVWKNLYKLTSEILFHTVYASVHPKDLTVLLRISQHPALRLLPREMIYSGVYFSTSLQGSTEGIPEASLQYYQDRRDEQNRVLMRQWSSVTVFEALKEMPNVRRVTLTNHWRPTRDLLGECDFETRFFGNVDIPDGATFGGPLSRDYPAGLKKPDGQPLQFRTKDSSLLKPDGQTMQVRIGHCSLLNIDYGFSSMCDAVSMAKAQVEELVIDYYDGIYESGGSRLPGGISPSTFNIPHTRLEAYHNLFRHLRRIAFSLCGAMTDEERNILQQGNLAEMLAGAENLEELTFDFTGTCNSISLQACLGTRCWPRLRLLRLYRRRVREAELSGLVQRHSKTLQVLHLENLSLTNGSWQSVAEKWHECLDLQDLRCDRLWEYVDSRSYKKVQCEQFKKYIIDGKSDQIIDANWRLPSS